MELKEQMVRARVRFCSYCFLVALSSLWYHLPAIYAQMESSAGANSCGGSPFALRHNNVALIGDTHSSESNDGEAKLHEMTGNSCMRTKEALPTQVLTPTLQPKEATLSASKPAIDGRLNEQAISGNGAETRKKDCGKKKYKGSKKQRKKNKKKKMGKKKKRS